MAELYCVCLLSLGFFSLPSILLPSISAHVSACVQARVCVSVCVCARYAVPVPVHCMCLWCYSSVFYFTIVKQTSISPLPVRLYVCLSVPGDDVINVRRLTLVAAWLTKRMTIRKPTSLAAMMSPVSELLNPKWRSRVVTLRNRSK